MDFTQTAKRAVELAHMEALALGLGHVNAQQILNGITSIPGDVALTILSDLGVSLDIRDQPSRPVVQGSDRSHVPFTDEAKRVFGIALAEASRLKCDEINTGHILLALGIVGEPRVADLDLDGIRLALMQRKLSDPQV